MSSHPSGAAGGGRAISSADSYDGRASSASIFSGYGPPPDLETERRMRERRRRRREKSEEISRVLAGGG
eukprot:CAMPEP_0183295900 /NCGR_PEP_ID=MMETSP0160_2-20130417/3679_1 /TAXON_ID=2839 ORGANISM="Odontella Sinensis, Strain Grunow 1884" /NCGR_SAMPLE_ID=MMETSP0160_2 /ASSEMBLY_ACC=CAM_ASM_000250 /LENGTH=68 /DNA_ID=CAMNT_0025457441 /DNA_START=26 /DNA_END=229 /DNA_ORIENTATION=-